jgi:hypothetical protein
MTERPASGAGDAKSDHTLGHPASSASFGAATAEEPIAMEASATERIVASSGKLSDPSGRISHFLQL